MGKHEEEAFDFAVPGEDGETEPARIDQTEQGEAAERTDISLFWLLQHYNKENAAAYKMQQSRKKEEKKNKKTGQAKKREKGKIKEDVRTASGSSFCEKEIPTAGDQNSRNEDDNFGRTVYLKRESRQGLTDLPARAAVLECLGYGQTVSIEHLPFMIGRSSSGVDLCIADNTTVGRMHAVISYHNGFYYIKDLKSLNHVFLNGKQIQPEKEIKLHDGTKILLGNEELVFHYDSKRI